MIHHIQPNESFDETRKDLDYTRQRLSRDAKASDLEPRLSALLAQLNEIDRGGGDSEAIHQALQLWLAEANRERCALFGELTARACTLKLNPSWPGNFFRSPQDAGPQPEDAPPPRGPRSPEEWIDVADERGADARAMLSARRSSTGPAYMIGYAIECSLKALLRKRNEPFPKAGSAGHDLRASGRPQASASPT